MFEHATIRILTILLVLGVLIYAVTLLIPNANYLSRPFRKTIVVADTTGTAQQESRDTVVPRSTDTYTYIFSDGKPTPTPATEIIIPSTTVVMDSDSVTQYNLYRKGKEAVHIDLEEHKEPIYFTWDDYSTWWRIVQMEVSRVWHRYFGKEEN